ncbi:MAG: hypothetical protein KTR35_20030 [Gammaproteobacteria bacterium]|nr:hypothetical protein [Gammaproteobacteria bacterium]
MDKASVHYPIARHLLMTFLVAFLISSCGGGGSSDNSDSSGSDTGGSDTGGSDGGSDSGQVNETVVGVLESFGVDTQASPRLDDNGAALPDDYSPLGTTRTVNRFEEAALFGVSIDEDAGLAGTFGGLMPVIDFDLVNGTDVQAELLSDLDTTDQPWFSSGVVRSAVTADIDADGLDEIVVAWQSEADSPVQINVIQDVASDAAAGDAVVIATGVEVQSLNLVSGDLDGDATIDIAVAITDTSDSIEVVVVTNSSGVLAGNGTSFSIAADTPTGYTHVALTTGNVDRDAGRELAVVVNRYGGDISRQTGSSISEATSRWYLLDDVSSGFQEMEGGLSVINTAGGPMVVKVADIALGDVDGDGVDELVIGGLDEIGRVSGGRDYFIEIRDDARSDFSQLASLQTSGEIPRQGGSGQTQYLHYLFVRTADLDGDGADEIVSNQLVWDDLRTTGNQLTPLVDQIMSAQNEETTNAQIDTEILLGSDQIAYYFSPVHVSFGVADINGDQREDVAFWVQRRNTQPSQQLAAFGLSQDRGFYQYASIETNFTNPQTPLFASLLLGDFEINGDTAALRLADGSYSYELTEPIVLAALAAAPCATDLGQDLSSCRTAIGSTSSTGNVETDGWSVFVNAQAGWDARDPITQSGGAILANVSREVRNYTTTAYTTVNTVLRETGPVEDTVIFTTIPYDVWTYEVLSHPDPAMIGRNVQVRMPREQIDIMTTREIYNSRVSPDAFKIDEAIFQHTAGDPGTYPSEQQSNTLLRTYRGLKSSAQTVGLNTGRQTVTIEQFEETTEGEEYRTSASAEVATVAGGFVMSVEIGGSLDSDLASIKGEGTIYSGQVAEIGPENPISASYQFGLFAYIYEPTDGTPHFEVLNYWVEDF